MRYTIPIPLNRTLERLIQAVEENSVYPEVIDNLSSTADDKPLSANMGKYIGDTYVKHTDDLIAGTVPVNADQLNGHADTYFTSKTYVDNAINAINVLYQNLGFTKCQYGIDSAIGENEKQITFSTPFTSAPYVVVVPKVPSNSTYKDFLRACTVVDVTKNGFSFVERAIRYDGSFHNGTDVCYWIAIGN